MGLSYKKIVKENGVDWLVLFFIVYYYFAGVFFFFFWFSFLSLFSFPSSHLVLVSVKGCYSGIVVASGLGGICSRLKFKYEWAGQE